MNALDERTARMALCALLPMGSLELGALVEREGAAAVWAAVVRSGADSAWGRRAGLVRPEALTDATKACDARFLVPGDPDWPPALSELGRSRAAGEGGPPLGLWWRGSVAPDVCEGAVAMVGARSATGYGVHVATDWAAGIVEAGRAVVSGMAFGVDAAAHRGALLAGGPTLAVLACGVDQPYPSAHAALMAAITGNGCVVSESPPGSRPFKASFLSRNRLIAALSQGLIVVEAAARSGARNTAAWAGELGRVLMAVPGPVTSAASLTPNRLIREGAAALVVSVADVLSLLDPLDAQAELPWRGEDTGLEALPADCRQVREAIAAREEVGVAVVSGRTGLTVPRCLAALDELVEKGWLEGRDGGLWALPSRRGLTA